ncbi:hypothetical protein BaRGS_00025464 [Batillaria attramentaria]|uniref:Fibronectin type III-like domain-containing protein n=1 Tax=Batillaria attramentaria TaxID=370345 RepID=A0ABD0K884_9CAEN
MPAKRTGVHCLEILVMVMVSCLTSHSQVQGDYPFRNVSLPWETRVDNLVSLLTLEELQFQMARGGRGPDVSPAPPIPRLGVGPYSWNTECLSGDVDAGPATSFPMALGMAATFSPDLVERVARATGLEVRAKYNNYTRNKEYGDHKGLSCFSPVINIMRDPRWGRNQETYGEDPILSGILATSFVRGLQGNDSRYVLANSGCKHFDVTDLDWQMTFLPAFRACVKAGTYNIMCSHYSINGVPACANKKLLTDILRNELGFKGYVISDEDDLERIVTYHHYKPDFVTAAAAALNAGVSLEISKNDVNSVFMHIGAAINASLVSEATVRERSKPLFYTRMRLGEFDPPAMNPYSQLDVSLIQSPAHQSLSLEAAVKSVVLLKNKDGFLPLNDNSQYKRVAVVGPMSNNPHGLYGDYSPTINMTLTVTPLAALTQLGTNVTYADGCNDTHCEVYDQGKVKAAVQGAEIIFVCLGTEAEGRDRPDVELPGKQLQLLKDAVTFSDGSAPVVLVLFNAGPLNVTWADQHPGVTAILECFFPAQTTGTALLHVLTNYGGTSSPAGRLPNTWPLLASDIPPMVDYSMTGRTYRYFDGDPLYPFGYGLSYTTFSYSDLKTPHNYPDLQVTQVYVSWPSTKFPTPRLQLVAVTRTTLTPGQPETLTFVVPAPHFAVYTYLGWLFPPGVMRVYAGGQQPNQQRSVGSNVLTNDVIITRDGIFFIGK